MFGIYTVPDYCTRPRPRGRVPLPYRYVLCRYRYRTGTELYVQYCSVNTRNFYPVPVRSGTGPGKPGLLFVLY
jgi:hypothetical protein